MQSLKGIDLIAYFPVYLMVNYAYEDPCTHFKQGEELGLAILSSVEKANLFLLSSKTFYSALLSKKISGKIYK